MVLMIDDDDDALEIYGMLVGKTAQANHFVTKNTGRAGLAFLQACNTKEAGPFPRYILVDLNMPGIDGLEFIEKYEEAFYPQHPETEIFILTSSVRRKDNEEALSYASAKKFITKPLSKEKLLSLIADSAS